MEMLRRNLKRQTSRSRSLSPLSVTSPADDQENLHPNLAAAPPSLANKPSTPPGLSKPVPSAAAAAAPRPASPQQQQQQRALAPIADEPAVKVVVRVRPAVSLPVDGKDIFFMRKTSPDSIAVGDRDFSVDGFLDDRASQEDAFCNNGGERGRQCSRPSARPRHSSSVHKISTKLSHLFWNGGNI